MITIIDKIRFYNACDKIINKSREKKGIGTLGEKTLHAVLKNYYEPNEENQEIKVGNYVADIVGEHGVIEIQTRNFNKLLCKLENFLEFSKVTVVYPIPKIKYVRWLDTDTGEISDKRKSPKPGKIYDCFKELYKIKYTLDNPNFTLRLCLLEVNDIRLLNGWSKDKKRGSSRYDRVPVDILEEIVLKNSDDYKIFLPQGLNENFTSAEFALNAKISKQTASLALNILTYLQVVERIGKNGNSILYKENENPS